MGHSPAALQHLELPLALPQQVLDPIKALPRHVHVFPERVPHERTLRFRGHRAQRSPQKAPHSPLQRYEPRRSPRRQHRLPTRSRCRERERERGKGETEKERPRKRFSKRKTFQTDVTMAETNGAPPQPRTIIDIYQQFVNRREGILKALVDRTFIATHEFESLSLLTPRPHAIPRRADRLLRSMRPR